MKKYVLIPCEEVNPNSGVASATTEAAAPASHNEALSKLSSDSILISIPQNIKKESSSHTTTH